MNSEMGKIVSFQIVQGYAGNVSTSFGQYASTSSYTPDVVALDELGALWMISLSDFYKGVNANWKRMTPRREFEYSQQVG